MQLILLAFMAQLQLFVIHCTATPEGRTITHHDIQQWHLAPLHNSDDTIKYKGKTYNSVAELPNEKIAGVPINLLKGRGWNQVGYSDMILLDGTLVNLVPYDTDTNVDPWKITNGATGINAKARHIVYVGGMDKQGLVPKDTRTPAQRMTLEAWVRTTIRYAPLIQGAGHNQFAAKACPSFNVPAWLDSIGTPGKNVYRNVL